MVLGIGFLCEYFIRTQLTVTGWSVHLPSVPTQLSELLIFTDGCCLSIGQVATEGSDTVAARGAYGIHFPNMPEGWGLYGALAEDSTHTNQKAELTAIVRALQFVRKRKIPCQRISLSADSKYAVQGLNEWIPRWRQNGYRTAKNRAVVNADLFRSLDEEVFALKKSGILVTLSHVPRDANRKADVLSRKGPVGGGSWSANPGLKPDVKPSLLLGRDFLIDALPLVQWTPDGNFWVQYKSIGVPERLGKALVV